MKSFVILLLLTPGIQLFAADARPAFQYDSGDIKITIPTAEEPKVRAFGAAAIKAAAKYLDDGAHAWMREKSCVACHTTGVYLTERPGLTRWLGTPDAEVLLDFVKRIPDKPATPKTSGDITYYSQADRAVWVAAGLAEWDKHVTCKLSEHTQRALRDMLAKQSSHGGYYVGGEVEIPYVTTDFELTVQAARAITSAPGWLAGLKDAELLGRVARLKDFLRTTKPRNDYERALKLELSAMMPDLVTKPERDAVMAMLWEKQRPDGGWSTRRMSDTRNWSDHMTDTVVKLIESQPDAQDPGSDAYMTAFAIVLLRDSGVPAADARIQRGIAWLKREQRESGRWWMQSLYRGKYQFITYIATCQALKALAKCDALEP